MAKTLIAFFSRADENYFGGAMRYVKVGNTEIVCGLISELIEADSFRIEMKTPYGSGTCTVVIGPDGKEYGSTFTKKSEGVYGDVLAEIEPLPGVEDKYLFVVRRDLIDIDPETLEPVKIDVV